MGGDRESDGVNPCKNWLLSLGEVPGRGNSLSKGPSMARA